jgi:hypothetical protein
VAGRRDFWRSEQKPERRTQREKESASRSGLQHRRQSEQAVRQRRFLLKHLRWAAALAQFGDVARSA